MRPCLLLHCNYWISKKQYVLCSVMHFENHVTATVIKISRYDRGYKIEVTSTRTGIDDTLLHQCIGTIVTIKPMYTQTKKKRPIFMVLYLSIQLRCRNRNKYQNVNQTSDTQKTVIV